jgi:hypothetical protein
VSKLGNDRAGPGQRRVCADARRDEEGLRRAPRLGYLLNLTRLPDRWKLALNAGAFLFFFVTLVSPMVVTNRATIRWLLVGGSCVFLASPAVLGLVLLWELWFGQPDEGFDAMPWREGGTTAPHDPP